MNVGSREAPNWDTGGDDVDRVVCRLPANGVCWGGEYRQGMRISLARVAIFMLVSINTLITGMCFDLHHRFKMFVGNQWRQSIHRARGG
jgi:hypothetical protein